MPEVRSQLTLPKNLNREKTKNFVISQFLKEKPGTGKGKSTSKYTYEVEYSGNNKIILKRPANLNKGMDFTVHVEGVKFRQKYANKDCPKHQDIIDELIEKKQANSTGYKKIKKS